jgi:hypothetical protein
MDDTAEANGEEVGPGNTQGNEKERSPPIIITA